MANEWTRLTLREWHILGTALFGGDVNDWKFICPSCGHVQSRRDWMNLGMNPRQIDTYLGFTCIGRWLHPLNAVDAFEESKGYGCRYIGTGIPNISPITLVISPNEERPTFGFAPDHSE